MADRILTATIELDTSDAMAKLAEIRAAAERVTIPSVAPSTIAAGDKITATSGGITSTGVVIGVIHTPSGFTVHAVHESALPEQPPAGPAPQQLPPAVQYRV